MTDPKIDWTAFTHAYGEAGDLPALLDRVSVDPSDSEAWSDLHGRLCHQGTVYPASYAALPLLLELARAMGPAERCSALILIAAIITSHDLFGIERRPVDVIDRIARAAAPLAEDCLRANAGDAITFLHVLEAAAAFDGDLIWGRNLQYLSDGAFEGQCPSCHETLHFGIGARYGFFVSAQDWVTPPDTRVAIQPAEPTHLSGRGSWLHERSIRYGQTEVAAWIRHLFGNTQCPACRQALDVASALTANHPRNDN